MPWMRLGTVQGLPGARGVRVVVAGRPLAVFKVGAEVYCIDDGCTHADASLAGGWVEGTTVMCPHHAAEFCLKTGQALSAPAYEGVRTYPVRVVEGYVEVEVPDEQAPTER